MNIIRARQDLKDLISTLQWQVHEICEAMDLPLEDASIETWNEYCDLSDRLHAARTELAEFDRDHDPVAYYTKRIKAAEWMVTTLRRYQGDDAEVTKWQERQLESHKAALEAHEDEARFEQRQARAD